MSSIPTCTGTQNGRGCSRPSAAVPTSRYTMFRSAAGLAPRARISLAAIVANVRAAANVGAGAIPPAVVDLRRDARGHGFADVCAALLTETDVDVRADAVDVARSGIQSARVLLSGEADIPPETTLGLRSGTTPALTLMGTVLGVKPLRAGEGVSYGYTFRAPADTRVALVTGGYAQGIPRSLGNRVPVSIAGAPPSVPPGLETASRAEPSAWKSWATWAPTATAVPAAAPW